MRCAPTGSTNKIGWYYRSLTLLRYFAPLKLRRNQLRRAKRSRLCNPASPLLRLKTLDGAGKADNMASVADVAELADAQASGACGGNPLEVRFLSSALPL